MNIKFARDGAEIDELAEEEVPSLLQSNILRRSDYFWHEGMAQWELVETRWPTISQKLKIDARAEIIWGRKPEQVLAMLRQKSIGEKDATALIEELMAERAAMIRADGVKKSIFGALFTLAPVAYYFFSMWLADMSIKLFAALLVLGAYGIGKLTNGLTMVFRPRAITVDLANAE
jgi:hypothetical protein